MQVKRRSRGLSFGKGRKGIITTGCTYSLEACNIQAAMVLNFSKAIDLAFYMLKKDKISLVLLE